MTSELLDLWLKPNTQTAPKKNSRDSSDATSYLPDRLRAQGNVSLGTPQIKANVNELQLWLVHAPANAPKAAGDALPLSDSAGNPMYQFVGPPSGTSSNPSANAPSAELPSNIPSVAATPNVPRLPTMVVVLLTSKAPCSNPPSSLRKINRGLIL